MNHGLIRILAQYAIYFMILLAPILWVLFTDRFRRQPAPGQYAAMFALFALIGIFLFLPALSIVFVTAMAAIGLAKLSARYALRAVSYERDLVPARLFPGDRAELVLRLHNRKILPLAWVTATDPVLFTSMRSSRDLDGMIHFSGGLEVQENLGSALVNRTALGPFQSLVRTYRIEARQRGVYVIGPGLVEAGDPFGVFRRSEVLADRLEVVIYPRVYRPSDIGLPFREALGLILTPQAPVQDPMLIAGSREYRYGDPLNRIHWKATARTGDLQVRVSDPSTTAQLMIVLNLNTYQHLWQGVDLERMEAVIETGASVATWALDRDFVVGLRSNGVIAGGEHTPRIGGSAQKGQATVLLEHLARISFSGAYSPESVLVDEARRLGARGTILCITSIITPELVQVLTSRALRGRVAVVYCGRHAAPVIRGVPVHLAVPPEESVRAVS